MNVVNNPIHPQDTSTGGTTTSTNGNGLPSSTGLNNMFLQLLVAQLQNQSPLNPMDPTQFVGQLAQFSELSEVTQIEQTLQQALPATSSTGSGSGSGSGGSGQVIRPAGATDATPSVVPAAITSAAVSAAQAAVPNFTAPAASILNHQIQGVF